MAGFEESFDGFGIDINAIIQSEVFFSVDTLMNMLIVFAMEFGVDITSNDFEVELALATSGDFFTSTSATFTFNVFCRILSNIGVSVENLTSVFEDTLGPFLVISTM